MNADSFLADSSFEFVVLGEPAAWCVYTRRGPPSPGFEAMQGIHSQKEVASTWIERTIAKVMIHQILLFAVGSAITQRETDTPLRNGL